jgi:hypothetical protein
VLFLVSLGVLQTMAASDHLAAQQQQQQNTSCMYGQRQQQGVQPGALDTEPTLLLCHVTADGATPQAELTLAQQGPARPSAAEASPDRAAPAAALRVRGPAAAAVLGRGLPSLKHVESKIKQSVAASRQKAAAQQQQRQRLLSSVVATSSSHRPGQQQQPKAAALEEACPPAATADQFISNPWTSWFVPGAPADLSVPAAAAAAAAVAAQGPSSSDDGCSSGEEVVAEPAQLRHSQGPCPAVAADVAASSRGALQDITSGLNQLKNSSSDGNAMTKPPPVEPWGLSADTFTFAVGDPSQQHAGSRQQDLQSIAAATGNLQWPAGQPQQQQQQQQQQRAWAADFGHLESAQLDVAAQQAAAAGAKRRAGPHQQRQQWRQRWVGDYGHLER